MLNPKPRAELPFEADDDHAWHAPAEQRSFALPNDAPELTPAILLGSAVAPWPQAWVNLDPNDLIQFSQQAANAPAASPMFHSTG